MQTYGEACIYKKVSGSFVAFLILYVDDILLMESDIEFLDSIPFRPGRLAPHEHDDDHVSHSDPAMYASPGCTYARVGV